MTQLFLFLNYIMPVYRDRDLLGPYYQWGKSGKKYYYNTRDSKSREAAKAYAKRQGIAIKADIARRRRQRAYIPWGSSCSLV